MSIYMVAAGADVFITEAKSKKEASSNIQAQFPKERIKQVQAMNQAALAATGKSFLLGRLAHANNVINTTRK